MCLHGGFRDHKPRGDLGVGQAGSHQSEYLEFAFGQLIQRRRDPCSGGGRRMCSAISRRVRLGASSASPAATQAIPRRAGLAGSP
jgi:hypothetical protein